MQQILDLGLLSGEVLLFGGVYSNLEALDALLAVASKRGIAPSNMICTGDLVAYCANPIEVVERVRSLGIPLVAGNCEIQLAKGAADCGCGFEEGSTCDLLAKGWYAHALRELSPELRAWMGRAPQRITFEHLGKRYGVIHGGASDVARFIWPTDENYVFAEEIGQLEAECGAVDVVIAGHSGIAFERKSANKIWCNAGVIGMPPNDGSPMSQYCLLGDQGREFYRLAYDHEAAALAMETAGLNQGYETALRTGVWPSQDILPDVLRRT